MADAHQTALIKRVSYLGPPGTFTHEAAMLYAPNAERFYYYLTMPNAALDVIEGRTDAAVAPIENSLQGAVTETLDVLIHGDDRLRICAEIAMPIVHNLEAKPGMTIDEVKMVYSHPQALGQCRRYLDTHLPSASIAASLSTSTAVEQAMQEEGAAAIAPRRAAEIYGAAILASGIQDDESNTTRFVVLALQDHTATGDDKTSLCFSFDEDAPGQLYGVMGEFARRGLNLSKIESRPTRMGLGQYYFLVDVDGHRTDPAVAEGAREHPPLRLPAEGLRLLPALPRLILLLAAAIAEAAIEGVGEARQEARAPPQHAPHRHPVAQRLGDVLYGGVGDLAQVVQRAPRRLDEAPEREDEHRRAHDEHQRQQYPRHQVDADEYVPQVLDEHARHPARRSRGLLPLS